MDPKHSIDELARQETVLKIRADLAKVQQDRRNGEPDIPVDEVIANMKAIAEANRRKVQNG